MITNDLPSNGMVCERSIGTLPARPAEATWQLVVQLIVQCVSQLGGDSQRVAAALGTLQPVAVYLLVTHALEPGSVEFTCGALRVLFRFRYGEAFPDDERCLPPLAALPPLPTDPKLRLTFRVAGRLPPRMARIIQSAALRAQLKVDVVALTLHVSDSDTNPSLAIRPPTRK